MSRINRLLLALCLIGAFIIGITTAQTDDYRVRLQLEQQKLAAQVERCERLIEERNALALGIPYTNEFCDLSGRGCR